MSESNHYLEFTEIDAVTKEPIRYEIFMGYFALSTLSNYVFKYLAEFVVPRNGKEVLEKMKETYDPQDPSSILALAGEEGVNLELNDADKNKIAFDSLAILKPFLIQWEVTNKVAANRQVAEEKYDKLFNNLGRTTAKKIRDWIESELDCFFLQEQWKPLNFQDRQNQKQ